MAQPEPSTNVGLTSTEHNLFPLGDVIKHIQDSREHIMTMIGRVPKKQSAQELGTVVGNAVDKIQQLLGDVDEVEQTLKDRLDDFLTALQETEGDVEYRTKAAITAKFRRKLRDLAKRQKHQNFSQCRATVDLSFHLLDAFLPSVTHPPTNTPPIRNAESSAPDVSTTQATASDARPVGNAILPASPPQPPGPATEDPSAPSDPTPKTGSRFQSIVDGTKKALQFASMAAEVVPDPASQMVKVVAATGLSIIIMLEDMDNNQEEAIRMARHIAQLVQSVQQFLSDLDDSDSDGKGDSDDESDSDRGSNSDNDGEDIRLKPLEVFQSALAAVDARLTVLRSQGKFKRGISHDRNKEDLKDCTIQIDRAFKELQTYMALHALVVLTKMKVSSAQRERDRLLDRLGGADHGIRSKTSNPEDLLCIPGTRTELLEIIDQWFSDSSAENIIWINGVAGCGKTAVAATIARRQREASATVATFYFDRDNQKRNESVVCSLARWLARASQDSLERFVLRSVQREPDIAAFPLTTQFERLLIQPLKNLAPASTLTILIVDALDEWHDPRQESAFISLIREHALGLPSQVRFVITSRNERHLRDAFLSDNLPAPVKIIQLDQAQPDVDHDIEAFLTARFSVIRSPQRDGTDWPGIRRIKQLVCLSEGLFQWAATVIRYIQASGRHEARLQDILKYPNRLGGLDTLYQHILDLLFQKDTRPSTFSLLQKILGNIVVAQVPISLDVIGYLQVKDTDDADDVKEEIRDEILASLGPFLIIPESSDQPIRVLHPSFADFITDPKRCKDDRFTIKRSFHHERLALSCLQRLHRHLRRNICNLDNPSKPNALVQCQVKETIPAGLQYASCHWADHLSQGDGSNSAQHLGLLDQFCQIHILQWLEVLSLVGQSKLAFAIAKRAERWVANLLPSPSRDSVRELLRDTQRFTTLFFRVISEHAGHIYSSALPQVPPDTALARLYSDSDSDGLRVLRGPFGRLWPASLWVSPKVRGPYTSVRFSPDGKSIVSILPTGAIRIWEVDSGIFQETPIPGHPGWVFCVVFSPDSQMIAMASSDRAIRVWDIDSRTAKCEPLKGHSDIVNCVAFSPDGTAIVSASRDQTVRIWDIVSGAARGEPLKGHIDSVSSAAFSPDGRTIVSVSEDGILQLWDAESGVAKSTPLKGHSDRVNCVAFSPNGTVVSSASRDRTVRMWDASSGVTNGDPLIGHSDSVNSITFSLDSKTIFSASSDGTIRMWDVEQGVAKGEPLVGCSGSVNSVELSPDGKMIVSAGQDGAIRVWDAGSGMARSELKGHSGSALSATFSPDSKMIVSAASDGTVRVWDADSTMSGGVELEGHSSPIHRALCSSDGKTIVSTSYDGIVQVWDAESGMVKYNSSAGHLGQVNSIVFSPDGKMIASASIDRTIRVWNADSGMAQGNPLEGHSDSVNNAVFSPDNKLVFSTSSDGTIRVWDAELGRAKGEPIVFNSVRSIGSLAFSPDGTTLVARDLLSMVAVEWDVRATFKVSFPPIIPSSLAPPVLALGLLNDGWLRYGRMNFWLSEAFGPHAIWKRQGARVIILHEQHLWILDVGGMVDGE